MGKKKKTDRRKASFKIKELSQFERNTAPTGKTVNPYKNYNDIIKRAEKSDNRRDLAAGYFGLVLSLAEREEFEEALNNLNKARDVFGDYLDAYFLELNIYYKQSEYEKSLKAGEEYLKIREGCNSLKDDYLSQSYNSRADVLWVLSDSARRTLDFKKSSRYQRKAVSLNPENHFRRIIFASNLQKDGCLDDAISVIDEGIKLFPYEAGLKNAKALIYGDAEKFDGALTILDEIIAENPKDVDAFVNRGVVLEKMGDYIAAEACFKKALKIDPRHQIANSNLIKLRETVDDKPQKISLCMIVKNEEKFLPGCLESAREAVDEIIVVDTGSTDRTMDIAGEYGAIIYEHPWQNDFSYHRNQSIDYATGDWILILDADEELDPTEHHMIRSAVRRKDIDAVSFIVYNKIQGGRTGFLNSHRLFRNKKEYRYSGIVHNQLVMDGITLSTQLKVYHHGYGLSEEQMREKGKRTEKLLKEQLKENPDNAFAHFNLAQIYRGLAEPEKSLRHARRVIEILSPDNIDRRHVYVMALDQIGCAYVGLDNHEKAKEYFYKALEIKEDYLDPLFNLGYVYSKDGEYDKADELFLRYLKVRDNFSEHREWMGLILNNLNSHFAVYYGLGLSQYFRNNIDKALDYFHQVIEEVEDFEYTQHLIARCYRQKRQYDKVVYHCRKAVENKHEDSEIYILLGEAYLNLGDHKKASESFEKALEYDDSGNASLLGLAGAASLEGDFDKASVAVDKALKKSPNSPQALAAKGDLNYHSRNFSSAAENYRKQSAASPTDPAALNNLGNCFFKQQNYSSAEQYYRRTLKLSSGFALAYRNLAVCLMKQNKFDESATFLEKYLENSPNDSEANATLGDIYYNSKNYWKAIGRYEKYIASYPGQHDAILRLADCYFNLGKIDSAKMGYKAVLRSNPDNKIAKNRLEEITRFTESIELQ
ncbi:MAG: tetratricopeptide repeat protein [Candidatus Zixiibacteriota bacterium]|nr:MAG: tetratricopeptide repeat protein [candidate division Zixibacteria bacterium]